MGQLYLVRHGQASFGADDYDQLSELGRRQAVQLGRYWAQRGWRSWRYNHSAAWPISARRHQW